MPLERTVVGLRYRGPAGAPLRGAPFPFGRGVPTLMLLVLGRTFPGPGEGDGAAAGVAERTGGAFVFVREALSLWRVLMGNLVLQRCISTIHAIGWFREYALACRAYWDGLTEYCERCQLSAGIVVYAAKVLT